VSCVADIGAGDDQELADIVKGLDKILQIMGLKYVKPKLEPNNANGIQVHIQISGKK